VTSPDPSAAAADRLVRPDLAALAGYTPGEQPQSGAWVKLNTNENPYPPSPRVAEAVVPLLAGRTLAKYPDPLATRFRERAAALHGVDPEWILCGNGSDDLLTILVRSFVGAGQWLRMTYPSYILYRTLALLQGAHCEEYRFHDDWTLDDGFAAPHVASGEPVRLAILANPNSPSGTCLPPTRVAALAAALPCPLVVDEAYGDFATTDCVELVRREPRVIVTRSLSKAYALAGVRFGYAVARPEIIGQLVKMKDSYNCDTLAVAAATAALDDRQWLAGNRAAIIATRARLTAELRTLGWNVVDSEANFVWCTRSDGAHRPVYEALKRRRILVRCMHYPGWGDGLRITVGTDAEIDTLLEALRTP